MPLPILHTYAGYLVDELASPKLPADGDVKRRNRFCWKTLLFIFTFSNLPDLDYLPGIALGKTALFHHGPSHSLFGALIVGLLSALTLKFFWGACFTTMAKRISALYASHVVLDYFSIRHSVPLLWPLSDHRFGSSSGLLTGAGMNTNHAHGILGFIDAIHSWSCFQRILLEILLIAIAFGALWLYRKLCKFASHPTAALSTGAVLGMFLWAYKHWIVAL